MHRFKAVTLLMMFAVAVWSVANFARAAESAWVLTPKIAAFDGRFGYEAYADRVVVIDNATGKHEVVRAGGRSTVDAIFAQFLAGNAEVASKLGVALSPETKVLGGKLSVQVFRNGVIFRDPAARKLWWSWHSQARIVPDGSSSVAPTAPKPGVFSAVIVDETGSASPAERQAIAGALRDFKVQHGVTIGVVFLKPMSLEAAQEKTKNYRQQFLNKNYLPESSAVFTLRDDASYIWQSDARVRGQISFDQVKQAWNKTSNSSNYAQLTQEFLRELSQMIGGQAPMKTPVKPPVNVPPENTVPVQITPVQTTSVNNAPVSSSIGSTPAAVQPGEIVAQKRIGPAGGSISAPGGGMTVEFPSGALKVEENVALRRTKATSPDAQFVYVDRDGGSTLLERPAKVRFTIPANVPAAEVLATQQLSDEMWMIAPSTYDAKTRTLEMDVLHFSGSGWFNKKNCIRAVGGLATALGTGLVWYTGAAVGVLVAVPASMTIGATAIVLGVGAVGAVISNPIDDYNQRKGLDGILALSSNSGTTDFVIRWKSLDYPPDKNILTVALDKQGKLVAAVPEKCDRNQFFAAMEKDKRRQPIDSFRTVPRAIFSLARTLIQTRMYYQSNQYDPPGAIEVLVTDSLSKAKSNEKHLGEWDEKFLRVHANLVKNLVSDEGTLDAAKDTELLATLMHEYWHVIYFAKGYGQTSKFSWLNEGMATALESESEGMASVLKSVSEGSDKVKFVNMHKATYIAAQLELGLWAINDPYSAWPLGKYFIHKKGGNYVTMVAMGMKGTTDWSGSNGLFADFVRSLLITEYALPDLDGNIPTGWGSIDVSEWASSRLAREDLHLGDNGKILLPPMSYSLRIARFSPPAGEAPSPLIIRRKEPNNTELFIALKPEVGAIIGQRRPQNAVSQGAGGVALPASWISQSSKFVTVPVGMANITTGAGSVSPLYIYRLQPPKNLTSAPAGGGVTLRWKLPALGDKLRAADALSGYRVFYQDKNGKTVMLPELLIKPDAETATIAASAMPGFTAVGLASEDQFVRDSKGKLALSPIAWPETKGGAVMVIVHEPKPDNAGPAYGFGNVLGGKPIPKALVTCDYMNKGKPVHLEAEADKNGVYRFDNVPFDVEISIGAQGATKKVKCTADKPQARAEFGWMGHVVIDKEGLDIQPPRGK